ncbi:MAG: hypothetical protein ACYS9X_26105 [Planctomycetota bacterium]
MKLLTPFSQGKFLAKYRATTGEDSLGICMRLSFKWLACRFVGGSFDYKKVNVKKASAKMDAYSREALDMIRSSSFDITKKDRFSASRYVVTDLLLMKDYINSWGVKVTDAKKTVYRNIHCAEAVRAPLASYFKTRSGVVAKDAMAVMMSFYMTFAKGFVQKKLPKMSFGGADSRTVMAGHSVAYFGKDDTFFDPNKGHFKLAATTLSGAATEIGKYVEKNYPVTGNSHDYNVLRIASKT